MRLYLQTQSSSVVLTGSYEEAQQNWLTPWLPGTDRFLAGTRRHTTTYLCETEYTGTGSSLKFSCPWWWCVFLAKWHSAIMHCAHHRLCWWAVIKNEEAQQNWLLTPWPWLHGTAFSGRYEKTHYICKTEHYTGTGSSLNFSCPWWWCVFLAKWLCDDVHCVSSGHH